MATLALFLLVISLQAALIYYGHFSPFERESNVRAVLWGAHPAPRYWAVVALDVCTGLLLALVVLAILPQAQNDIPLNRLARFFPAWILLSLLAAVLHSHVNDTVIRFPNYGLMARRVLIVLMLGIIIVGLALFVVALAIMPDVSLALTAWTRMVPALLLPALLLALAAFLVRACAFFLRVLPVIGNLLHAALSTGALVWTMQVYGTWMSIGPLPASGLNGLEPVALALAALAIVALVLAWRLPGPGKHADAVDPPALVISAPGEDFRVAARLMDSGATLESSQARVQVNRAPFGVIVSNSRGETLWELAERGVTRDLLLQKILSIPLLYTGNTIKRRWRARSRPAGRVNEIRIEERVLVVSFADAVLRLRFHAPDVLHLEYAHSSRLTPHTSLTFCAPGDAHYLGFGQRFNKIDQRGEETYCFVEEGGVGYEWLGRRVPLLAPLLERIYGARGSWPNGPQCTGFPVPFCLVSREQGATTGLFWNTWKPSWFDAARGPGAAVSRLTVLDNKVDLYLCAGPTASGAMRQYTELTGRSEVPPPWVFLPWKTRTGAVTEADALEDIHRFRELGIPLAHVGIEHWQEIRGSYEFSKQWYPHIDNVVREAHENGMRITVWHFPYMNAGAATHREGVRRGYLLQNRLGLPYQQRIFHGVATVIDYTNPAAAAWHEEIVEQTFYRRGFSGAMTDYGESIPPDSVFYNGCSGLAMRNAYPVLYCQSMQRAARRVLGDDYLLYPRAGYAGSQRFVGVQWPGDQDTDWDNGDGLPAAVRAMLNVSMCGFPVHGSDIGGWYDWFTPPTTKELYIRWAEVGAYSPLMRAHGGPIGRNREPWKFDEETVQIYRALSEEHVKLFPLLYSLAKEYVRTGAPIIRHPALIWPGCAELYQVEDAWLIGDALYVAPVVKQGQTRREVILPPGEWWSFNDDKPVAGPSRLDVDAPLGRTPRFLRRGFILPRFVDSFDTFDQVTTARVGKLNGPIEAWLYPDPDQPASFILFDGTRLEEGKQPGNRQVTWQGINETSEI